MLVLLSLLTLTVAAELPPSNVCSDEVCAPDAAYVAPPGDLVMLQAKARLHDNSATLQHDKGVTCKCKSVGKAVPNNGYECSNGEKSYCPAVATCNSDGDWAKPTNKAEWGQTCVQMPEKICGNADLKDGYRMQSPNGKAALKVQGDGNLVLFKPDGGNTLWATNKFPGSGAKVIMQDDCNLVVYGSDGQPKWDLKTDENILDKIKKLAKKVVKTANNLKDSSDVGDAINRGKAAVNSFSGESVCRDRARDAGVCLKVQDDCNLVIYRSDGQALWDSKTSC